MITVVCGEDIVASRNYYLELKKQAANKGYQIFNISYNQIFDILSWLSQSYTLFGEKKVFFIENLNKHLPRITKKDFTTPTAKIIKTINEIARSKEIQLIDWENEKSGREIKMREIAIIKEFKPSNSIFKLNEACYPSNLKNFLSMLNQLTTITADNFIFIMLSRHIKNLLLAKLGLFPANQASWQRQKLVYQAKYWDSEKLIKFYDGLYRIELGIKTSSLPYGIKKSLDILACYFL